MSIFLQGGAVPKNGRTFVMPAVEDIASTATGTIEPLHTFQVRMRDTMDYTVDLSRFLQALGDNVALSSAVFTLIGAVTSKGVNAPAPTLVGQNNTSDGKAILIIRPAAGASNGDLYTVEMVATTTEQNIEPNKVLPSRVITRRLQLQVVPG